MWRLASLLALALLAASSQPAPAQKPGQLTRLTWQSLSLKYADPQNQAEVTIRFERRLDPLSGPRLESIVVMAGTQSYVVRGPSVQLIRADNAAAAWATLYVDRNGEKYVSLFIPEPGGAIAEVDVLAMKAYRINFRGG